MSFELYPSMKSGEHRASEVSAEQVLFQTVVFHAVLEALYDGHSPTAHDHKYWAHQWIKFGGKDYRMVCALAGIDPDFLREKYLAGDICTDALKRSSYFVRGGKAA